MKNRSSAKSGQAIIFLMVVLVLGLFIVVWNYDLHRIVLAKNRMRNAGDAAVLTAARWQGITLNMIGDLNLVQAAVLSEAYADDTDRTVFEVPGEVGGLHELRKRLEYVGPLAAFALAQQAAFNNGAFHDPDLAEDLRAIATIIRFQADEKNPPYDNAFKDYADLLDYLADNGVAASSYPLRLPGHVLADERFYSAIAQAVAGRWCPMRDYRYHLKNYGGVGDWPKFPDEFSYGQMLDLKLGEFTSAVAEGDGTTMIPPIEQVPDSDDFYTRLRRYLGEEEDSGIIEEYGDPGYVSRGMYPFRPDEDILWHVYGGSWARTWPKPAYYDEEVDERGGRFPIRSRIRPQFDYMGAEAGMALSAPVARGILASSDNETVGLAYKTKAKAFGYLDTDGFFEVPHYFGFVFPAFEEVRLIHSDIGDKVLDAEFYRHVVLHLHDYLAGGPEACRDGCRYCELLRAWEDLDRKAGTEWLEQADKADEDPCKPEEEEGVWGKAGGGATGGS